MECRWLQKLSELEGVRCGHSTQRRRWCLTAPHKLPKQPACQSRACHVTIEPLKPAFWPPSFPPSLPLLRPCSEVPAFGPAATALLDQLAVGFSLSDALAVKGVERTTNHDVKAIEYVLKDKFMADPELAKVGGWGADAHTAVRGVGG